jgi:hypothetical protein
LVGPYGLTPDAPLNAEHCTGVASLHAETEIDWAFGGSAEVVNFWVLPSAHPPQAQVPLSPPVDRHLTEV